MQPIALFTSTFSLKNNHSNTNLTMQTEQSVHSDQKTPFPFWNEEYRISSDSTYPKRTPALEKNSCIDSDVKDVVNLRNSDTFDMVGVLTEFQILIQNKSIIFFQTVFFLFSSLIYLTLWKWT